MIKTAQDMIRALRRDTFCGVILYQGPSLIDGAPIVVIANRIVAERLHARAPQSSSWRMAPRQSGLPRPLDIV